MSRAHAGIDIESIRLMAHHDNLCAEFMKHRRRHMIGSPMGAVHYQSQPPKGQARRKGVFTELNISAAGIVESASLAQRCGGNALHRLIHCPFYFQLDSIGEFFATAIKKLNAVIVKWIVRSADYNSSRQAHGTGEISHRRGWHWAHQQHIHACSAESRL